MMKTFFKALAIVAVIGVTSSCEDITEMNHNPNALLYGTVNPESMLDDMIYNTSNILLSKTFGTHGDLIQYCLVNSTSITFNQYNVSSSATYNIWNGLYHWAAEASHIKFRARQVDNTAVEAMAIIIQTLLMQNATDIFGDVPFSDGFQTMQGNSKPRFDTQQQIYQAFESDLRYANDLLAQSPSLENPDKDLLFRGDMVKWRKFCNSLLLRVLMRQSNRDASLGIGAKIKYILTSPDFPIFESIGDAAVLYFDSVQPFVNYYGSKTDFEASFRATEFMVDNMVAGSDPRLSLYFKKSGSKWKGAASGNLASEGSIVGAAYLNQATLGDYSSPFAFMRYDEVLFILAEAAQKGWIAGNAGDYYSKALTASLDYWELVSGVEISASSRTKFLSTVAYDGTYGQLITQKFISMFGVGYEGWAEYRRTGYPLLKIGTATMNDHILPTRFAYPLQEPANNPDSYQWALERLKNYYKGGDDMKTPVWWSKQAVESGIE